MRLTCRTAGEDWEASFGYFQDLIQDEFADPAPMLHTDAAADDVNASIDSDQSSPSPCIPRGIGFRAQCLTVQAEQTCGE